MDPFTMDPFNINLVFSVNVPKWTISTIHWGNFWSE